MRRVMVVGMFGMRGVVGGRVRERQSGRRFTHSRPSHALPLPIQRELGTGVRFVSAFVLPPKLAN
ncbi:hypothetical protein C1280_15260 [Gemmata obscuriglobus]|uniref:Uncharacterized protein n=1 Tax=Gemmata obscuriglobus TaxID=114 RepID=A0A2Z3HAL7_9BACT|nr:hypothetical protein C1280_15260 [Gemmata obscuriglobus]